MNYFKHPKKRRKEYSPQHVRLLESNMAHAGLRFIHLMYDRHTAEKVLGAIYAIMKEASEGRPRLRTY